MPDITDELIKEKHREFNQRIKSIIGEIHIKPKVNIISRLREVAQRKRK